MRWVFLGLYLAIVVGLSVPFFLDEEGILTWAVMFGGTIACQALLIFGAGTIRLCRPIRKQRLWMPVLAATGMMFVLSGGLLLSLFELEFGDDNPSLLVTVSFMWVLWGNWVLWAPLIWIHVNGRRRMSVLGRLTRLMFVGSLAELLACVPSHMITSRRSYCLAGTWTMVGVIAGIYVMLFSFGPAVVLLFLRPRYRREQMEQDHYCLECDYDLRGTLAAGRSECPECGAPVPPSMLERPT